MKRNYRERGENSDSMVRGTPRAAGESRESAGRLQRSFAPPRIRGWQDDKVLVVRAADGRAGDGDERGGGGAGCG